MESQTQESYAQNGLKHSPPTEAMGVVMVPLPAQGHLNQLLLLSRLITSSYGIPVHFVGSTTHNQQAKLRANNNNNNNDDDEINNYPSIHFHDLQVPPLPSLPSKPTTTNNHPFTHFPAHSQPLLEVISTHFREPVFQLLQELATTKYKKRLIVIHDSLMASVVQDVKSIPNAEAYNFKPISAFAHFFLLWMTIPKKPFKLDIIDDDNNIVVPSKEGCFTPEFDKFVNKQGRLNFQIESGVLFNTSRVIEGRYMELTEKLTKMLTGRLTKHFAIGPLNPLSELGTRNTTTRHRCLEWLDHQEIDSVLYVSFGTTTSMSREQIRELAIGLERSDQKFIWVLRNADETGGEDDEELVKQLPDGFIESNVMQNRGLVLHKDWAPQLEILAHPSIGGFMSHCGWNSCMESISMGVPIIAWPMHSDQPQNAALVTQVLGTGILINDWANRAEIVTSVMVEDLVRRLLTTEEGNEKRTKAKELGTAIRDSLDQGGASRMEVDSFIAHITRP